MSENESGKSHSLVMWVLFLGLAIAIGGNVYESMCRDQLERNLRRAELNAAQQIAKVNDTTKDAIVKSRGRLDALENQVEEATDAGLKQVRSELKRSSSQFADGVELKRQQLASQIADLRVDTSEKLGRVSNDLESTSADVKRFAGDVGAISGQVAANSKELAALKELGERNYVEFALTTSKEPQKIGNIRLLLTKADPKHNRYTVRVWADDKIVEKKDRTINEPVQLYISDSPQPYEIVVNDVRKGQVAGYLSTPKVKSLRSQL